MENHNGKNIKRYIEDRIQDIQQQIEKTPNPYLKGQLDAYNQMRFILITLD